MQENVASSKGALDNPINAGAAIDLQANLDFPVGDEQASLYSGIQLKQLHSPLKVKVRGLQRVHSYRLSSIP